MPEIQLVVTHKLGRLQGESRLPGVGRNSAGEKEIPRPGKQNSDLCRGHVIALLLLALFTLKYADMKYNLKFHFSVTLVTFQVLGGPTWPVAAVG